MSLLAGIDYSQSDAIIMMDSDLQHPPELIPKLLEAFEQGYDIVHTFREDPPEIGFIKRITSRAFYWFLNRLSDTQISENTADFRLISRKIATIFQTQIRERNMFLRGLFAWVGFKATTIPFRAEIRMAGKSKYSFGRMIRLGIDGILSFSRRPLRAATVVGLVMAGFGFLLALVTTVQYFYDGSFPPGWTTLLILITIFSGTQLIFMGILGEYIAAIFDEVKARPHYIVEEAINMPDNPVLGPKDYIY
jgi:dolichol-phosphate mannosyltransferase